jgi:NAD(P)-dependent dehydrogenase (short-subunit alcohol dehydrogenase family)
LSHRVGNVTSPAPRDHGDGGVIVITSSAAGFKSVSTGFDMMSHGAAGHTAAKHGVIGVMRHFAASLAENNIRVDSIHPGGVATPMIFNEAMGRLIGDQPDFGAAQQPKLSLPPMDPEVVTDAMVLSVRTVRSIHDRRRVAIGGRPFAHVIWL